MIRTPPSASVILDDADVAVAQASERVFAPVLSELASALAEGDYEAVQSIRRRIDDANLDRLQYGSQCGVQWALKAREMVREHFVARNAETLKAVRS